MRGDDEPRRAARNLRSLLRQAPDFLDEAAAVVRSPERVWLRVMEQTVAGGMEVYCTRVNLLLVFWGTVGNSK